MRAIEAVAIEEVNSNIIGLAFTLKVFRQSRCPLLPGRLALATGRLAWLGSRLVISRAFNFIALSFAIGNLKGDGEGSSRRNCWEPLDAVASFGR